MDAFHSNKMKMWGNPYGFIPPISNSNPTGISENGIKKDICLCRQIQWIWRLSQLIGINPLSFKCGHEDRNLTGTRPKRRNSWKCELQRRKIGYPVINNILSLLFHTLSAIKMSTIIILILTVMFKGTDVYACRMHFAARIWQTLTLIAAGGLFPHNLVKAWDLIQTVSRSINHVFPNFIKKWSISLTAGCIIIGITNTLYTAFATVKFCFLSQEKIMQEACLSYGLAPHLSFIFSMGSSEVYHLTLASLLFIFALVVKSLSRGVADLVKETLESEDEDNFLELDEELERLRLVYERIYTIVVFLRKCFGVSALTICCDAVLTCIFGIYWRILYFENLSLDPEAGVHHFLLFSSQMTFSVMSFLLILISGQLIVNSSLEVVGVIRMSRLARLNSAARFQINLFLQSSSGFPTKFSVYFITNLEMRFLAAAATNVITYLLVLMQFRLEQDNSKK